MGGGNNPSDGSGLRYVANPQPYPRAVVVQNASPQDFTVNDATLTGATLALFEFILTPGAAQAADSNVGPTLQIKGDTNNGGGGVAAAWSKMDTTTFIRLSFTNFAGILVPVTAGACTFTLIDSTSGGNFGTCEWRIIGVLK